MRKYLADGLRQIASRSGLCKVAAYIVGSLRRFLRYVTKCSAIKVALWCRMFSMINECGARNAEPPAKRSFADCYRSATFDILDLLTS